MLDKPQVRSAGVSEQHAKQRERHARVERNKKARGNARLRKAWAWTAGAILSAGLAVAGGTMMYTDKGVRYDTGKRAEPVRNAQNELVSGGSIMGNRASSQYWYGLGLLFTGLAGVGYAGKRSAREYKMARGHFENRTDLNYDY